MISEHSDIEAPPLEPTGEIMRVEDPAFKERCLSVVNQYTSGMNWELERELLSRSPRWGLVWRGDYALVDLAPNLVNRIMCWEGADGKLVVEVAVGQRVAPLPLASPGDPGST